MLIYNSAVARVPIVMVDATDDETPETGLTVQVFLSKNGAALTSVINGFAEVGQGLYYASLTAAETNTDGFLFILATASGADIWRDYHEVVSSTATPSGVASRAEVADTIWHRVLTASPTTPGAAGLMVSQVYATMTTGPLATVTAVNYPVPLNWASISGANTSQILAGTVIASVNYPVPLNWASISGSTSTQNFTGTTIASVSNVATVNFVASASAAILSSVGTVTGVTNSVNANVTTITGVTNSVSVSTVQGVTNTVFATLTKAVRAMIADDWLARSIAGGSDGGRTNQDAMRLLRNRRSLTFGTMNTATLTAFQENDSTTAWTAIVSTGSAVGLTDVDAS